MNSEDHRQSRMLWLVMARFRVFLPPPLMGKVHHQLLGNHCSNEVTDFEAPLLVQSHGCHIAAPYWPRRS